MNLNYLKFSKFPLICITLEVVLFSHKNNIKTDA